jgi:hypothetical protein
MSLFNKTMALAIGLEALSLTGCALTAPVEGKPEITRQDNVALAGNALVTVGPRRLLDFLAKQIAAMDAGLEPVDALLFRDTAFPEGGWHLQEMLDEGQRARIAQTLQVDYLILVTPLVYTVGDESGFFVPLVAGAQSAAHKSSVSATIYDMKSGAALGRIDVAAIGQERVYSYVILFTGTTPHVVKPALDALVKQIVQTVRTANRKPRMRIAILAAESLPQPK